MFKLGYIITQYRYVISEFLNKIIAPFDVVQLLFQDIT